LLAASIAHAQSLPKGTPAAAPTADWRAVENLAPGSIISLKSPGRHHLRCRFERADIDLLVCERIVHGNLVFGPTEIVLERRNIDQVRLEHSEAANAATGALLGAGAGAAIGASVHNGTLTRPGGALLIGAIGGIIGGFVGRDVSILPGKIIYQR
jgi:hypothetical protein